MWGQKLEYMKSSLTCNFRPTYATILTPFIINLLQRIMLKLSDTGFPYMWSIAFVWWHFNNIYIYISQTVKTGYGNLKLIRKISTFFDYGRKSLEAAVSFLFTAFTDLLVFIPLANKDFHTFPHLPTKYMQNIPHRGRLIIPHPTKPVLDPQGRSIWLHVAFDERKSRVISLSKV